MEVFLSQRGRTVVNNMKMPNFLRINKGDYPESSQEIVDRLAGSLNIAIDTLFLLSNNRISLKDNIASTVKDITVTVNTLGIPTSFTGIALGTTVQTALGSDVILAENQTVKTNYPTAKPFITFTQNGSTFVVDHIAGLPANNQFLLRVLIWGA